MASVREAEKYMLDQGYRNVKFIKMDGKYFIFSADSTWNGKVTVEVEEEFFGFSKREL
ncbi:hypothetical protein [Macrococcoides canis]|uniref:hypothetical protein n=1 Tax=Macrococcoides canis TaxID=1855823 RepID=UPI0020B74677|nr:hypothetical protein [Macrococcus canis]UTH00533.1 hypothetical protein KFV04_02390 [Macrococcus canis]